MKFLIVNKNIALLLWSLRYPNWSLLAW